MVKNAEDLIEISRENAFGGLGSLFIVDYLSEKECKGKLNFLRRLRLEPGSSLGEHSHTSNFEIYFILKGEGLLIDDGIEKKVGVGDMIYTADGASHSLINQGVEDLEFLAFIVMIFYVFSFLSKRKHAFDRVESSNSIKMFHSSRKKKD